MARLVRYTCSALKRGPHRRGDVITVPEGSEFDAQHKADKAWTRTLMPAHTPTPGPAPDQGVQAAYRALVTFLREAADRTRAFDGKQREAYALLLKSNRREVGELLIEALPVPPDLDDDTEEEPLPEEPVPSEPAPEVIQAEPAKAVLEKEHHPSFTDEERRRFFAALASVCEDEEMDKETAYALAETVLERVRPSSMTTESRDSYLAWLQTPEGRTAYARFAGEELLDDPPQAEPAAPAPHVELVATLDAVIAGTDTSTTLDALVAAARSAGLVVPDALPKRRVALASTLRALFLPSTSPLTPPSPADLGDD